MKINMKRLVAWLLGITLLGLGSSIFLYRQAGIDWTDMKSIDSVSSGKYSGTLEDTITFDSGDFDRITVKTISSPLDIVIDSGYSRAEFEGSYRSSREDLRPMLVKEISGRELNLEIKYPRGIQSNSISTNARLTLYLPQAYKGELKVESVSGNIGACDLSLEKFSAGTVSGNIRADRLDLKEGILESVSGSIDIDSLSGRILGKTTSGNMRLSFESIESTVYLESISGELSLKMPQNASFTLKSETLSGAFDCALPLVLKAGKDKSILADISGGGSMVELKTVSGDITLQ